MAMNHPVQLPPLDEITPQPSLVLQNRIPQAVKFLEGLKLSTGRKLKKEYVRVQIIRLHKKYLRMLILPKKICKALRTKTAKLVLAEQSAFAEFKEWSIACGSQLKEKCLTESGPETDGKAKRKGASTGNARSCNNSFVNKYLDCFEMKRSFYLFIEYIFASNDPNLIKRHLKYACCLGTHADSCLDIWHNLKRFYQIQMLGEPINQVFNEVVKVEEDYFDEDSYLQY